MSVYVVNNICIINILLLPGAVGNTSMFYSSKLTVRVVERRMDAITVLRKVSSKQKYWSSPKNDMNVPCNELYALYIISIITSKIM